MDRTRTYDNQGIRTPCDMTSSLSASPPAGLVVPGSTFSDAGSSYSATRRYSKLWSHPFAASNTVVQDLHAAPASTEYFGQIDFDRPQARSYYKGKARATDSNGERQDGSAQYTNGVHQDSSSHTNLGRQDGPQGGSAIKPFPASGSTSTKLFYQPQPQLTATSEECQDTRSIYRAVQSAERTPRATDTLAEQRISGLSKEINTATHPGYEAATPISATARAQSLLSVDTPTCALPTGPHPRRPDHTRSKTASSSTSTTASTSHRRRDRVPSRDILQSALDLAQKAVEYDGVNDIPAALEMYREAVSKLRSVMGRVGLPLEPISPDLGVPELGEREHEDIFVAARRRKAGIANRSEEEGKTLKGIHDAYVARIGLLRVMAGEKIAVRGSPITHSPLSQPSTLDVTPSQSIGHCGLSGIDNLMMNGFTASPIAEGGGDDDNQHHEISTGGPALAQGETTVEFNRMGDAIPHSQPPTISPRKASLNTQSVYAVPHAISPSPSFASFNRGRASRRPSGASTIGQNMTDTSYEVISTAGMSLRIPDPPIGAAVAFEPQSTNATSFRGSNLKISSGPLGDGQLPNNIEPDTEVYMSAQGPELLADGLFSSPDDTALSIRTMTMAQGSTENLTSMDTSTSLSLVRAPFRMLRQIRQSMISPQGDYISPALFVPRAAWNQAGVKIPSMETKIRVMELLSHNLSNVNTAGSVPNSTRSTGVQTLESALEDFEALSEEARRLLTKKLGDKVNFAKPRKSNSSTISSWGSKFSKTFDKMGSSKSADSLLAYMESLARLCLNAQVFGTSSRPCSITCMIQRLIAIISPRPPFRVFGHFLVERPSVFTIITKWTYAIGKAAE
ncbi:hypothetical protein QFC21_000603 [Naganishia friedmannii]|uniref:Uncharacterized protein n=1 Tax=Naganishia friedmannii TaxID=89922 RepID=A0ACC2WDK1_9TREE|nr:hypothetical protein QFC21_000603 [Naganishia friedmannii]